MIRLQRAYQDAGEHDGFRVLVDRLWPRGLSKERARLDLWLREVAPSTQLREWYGHRPDRQPEFERRYRQELAGSEGLETLVQVCSEHPIVTLLTATRDIALSELPILQSVLEASVRSQPAKPR